MTRRIWLNWNNRIDVVKWGNLIEVSGVKQVRDYTSIDIDGGNGPEVVV